MPEKLTPIEHTLGALHLGAGAVKFAFNQLKGGAWADLAEQVGPLPVKPKVLPNLTAMHE